MGFHWIRCAENLMSCLFMGNMLPGRISRISLLGKKISKKKVKPTDNQKPDACLALCLKAYVYFLDWSPVFIYHSWDFIGYVVLKIWWQWCHASTRLVSYSCQTMSKLNLSQTERPTVLASFTSVEAWRQIFGTAYIQWNFLGHIFTYLIIFLRIELTDCLCNVLFFIISWSSIQLLYN